MTQNLTKITSWDDRIPVATAAEIESRLRALKSPASYLAGREVGAPLQPRDILLFLRTSRKELALGPSIRSQHHRYVLITAVRGSGVMGINTRMHHVREGQSILVLPFQAHWYESHSSADIRWFFVTFEHEKDPRLEALRDRGGVDGGEEAWEAARDVLRYWQTPAETDLLGPRFGVWLHLLAQRARLRRRSSHRLAAPSPDGEWMIEINRYILENRQLPISVAQLARQLHISASLLRSKFHRLAGYPVGRHIRMLKLQHACELLHDTRLRINEVAERCGYDSLFSFSRAFHNAYRTSPSRYRKKLGRA